MRRHFGAGMLEHAAPSSRVSPLMRIEIGNHPQEHAFSGSGLAGNRDTFARPKCKIDWAQMKPAQCMAFEHAKQLSFRVVGPIFVGILQMSSDRASNVDIGRITGKPKREVPQRPAGPATPAAAAGGMLRNRSSWLLRAEQVGLYDMVCNVW